MEHHVSEKRLINLENHVLGIKQDIASLSTLLSSHIETQKGHSEEHKEIANDHESRIANLEGLKNRVIGACVAISAFIGLFADAIKNAIVGVFRS